MTSSTASSRAFLLLRAMSDAVGVELTAIGLGSMTCICRRLNRCELEDAKHLELVNEDILQSSEICADSRWPSAAVTTSPGLEATARGIGYTKPTKSPSRQIFRPRATSKVGVHERPCYSGHPGQKEDGGRDVEKEYWNARAVKENLKGLKER